MESARLAEPDCYASIIGLLVIGKEKHSLRCKSSRREASVQPYETFTTSASWRTMIVGLPITMRRANVVVFGVVHHMSSYH